MKNAELRELTADQLQQRASELDLQLFNHRFKARMGTLEKPAVLRETRREIARIKTILTEKQG